MASNNFTKAVTQEQSSGKMLQKYTPNSQRNTHTDVQIQPRPGGNNIEITRLSR